jgi:hypothetical protein
MTTDDLRNRTVAARQRAWPIFLELGYRESPGQKPPLGSSDRIWHKYLPDSGMQIHFEEFSWVDMVPRIDWFAVYDGAELTYTVGTWSNNPHIRFEMHGLLVHTKFDILAAESQVIKFVEAFRLTHRLNVKGDGIDRQRKVMCRMEPGVEAVSSLAMGVPSLVVGVRMLREECRSLCPEPLDELEKKLGFWRSFYLLAYRVSVPDKQPLGCNVSFDPDRDDKRGERIQLETLGAPAAIDQTQNLILNPHTVVSFSSRPGYGNPFPRLREFLEDQLTCLEAEVNR